MVSFCDQVQRRFVGTSGRRHCMSNQDDVQSRAEHFPLESRLLNAASDAGFMLAVLHAEGITCATTTCMWHQCEVANFRFPIHTHSMQHRDAFVILR